VKRRRHTNPHEPELTIETLSMEGNLLFPEWLSKIAQRQADKQTDADYRIPQGQRLHHEIDRCWHIAQTLWTTFSADPKKNTITKAELFVSALLRSAFGFESLAPVKPASLKNGLFSISYAAVDGRVPIVVAPAPSGLDTLLDAFGDANRKPCAYGLLQEYLHARNDALWGIASDGARLRIVRHDEGLTRPAWIEADLRRIFVEKREADFAALWLLCHGTRFGPPNRPVAEGILEKWCEAGKQQRLQAREQLRRGAQQALIALGQGFLSHPRNEDLRAALQNGTLSEKSYFNQLLRLVYRFIFLFTAEERGLLHPEKTPEPIKTLYENSYGMGRLRELARKRGAVDHVSDLWATTLAVCRGLAQGEPRLGLPALAGIFATNQCPDLDRASLDNHALLAAVFHLAWRKDDDRLYRIDWHLIDSEQLGSVYESLLELVAQTLPQPPYFSFVTDDDTQGNTRKTTGSYYTPDTLVRVLLDHALEPAIARTIADHPSQPTEALLRLTICDPACGSGHFLLAAAHRLASHAARRKANGTASPAQYQSALRHVIRQCLFGVDLNPMAVELCKIGLWLETAEPGLPLTFLDSHIQHGNAILGATAERMANGIPDAAWDPVEGDDKRTSRLLKKRNKFAHKEYVSTISPKRASAGSGPQSIRSAATNPGMVDDLWLEHPGKKQEGREATLDSSLIRRQKLVADAWCAAFVWPKQPGQLAEAAPTNDVWLRLRDGLEAASALTEKTVHELAEQYCIFHWHLQFPQIFKKGGFDVVLGNPPWIAHAGRAAQPLPPGVRRFFETNCEAFADYPTTHGLFASVIPEMVRIGGHVGLVVPSSMSELQGYAPTRSAHDRLCEFFNEMTDFGEGRFEGVTQPCMALVSRRSEKGRQDAAPGEPWPMARPELSAIDQRLLERLLRLPPMAPELFGERGVQSDKTLTQHFVRSAQPIGRFTTPIREGTDVREFNLLPPRFHVDSEALGPRIRSAQEFATVRVVLRQTARYPIAALSDGLPFRNSLLAAFESSTWPATAIVALLNSALIRWWHYQRFRDARQPVMPQVKIGHLRAIPMPPSVLASDVSGLADVGRRMSASRGDEGREQLDSLVADLYGLTHEERATVEQWHQNMGPKGPGSSKLANFKGKPPRRHAKNS